MFIAVASGGAASARGNSKSSNNHGGATLERKATRKVTINSEGGHSSFSQRSPSWAAQVMPQLWAMEGKLTSLEEQLASSYSHLSLKLEDIGSRLRLLGVGGPWPAAEDLNGSSSPPPPDLNGEAMSPTLSPTSPKLSPKLVAFANQLAPPKSVAPATAPACIAGSLPKSWLPPISDRSEASLPLPSGDNFTLDFPMWEVPKLEKWESDAAGEKAEAAEGSSDGLKRSTSADGVGKANDRGRRSSRPSLDSIEDLKALTSAHAGWRVKLFNAFDDPDSGSVGKAYALGIPYVIFASVTLAMLQTSTPPLLQGAVATAFNVLFESFFLIEFCLRLVATPTKRAFVRDYNNTIDFLVILPLFIRAALGFRPTEGDQCGGVCVALMCFVPLIRSLKILRRFENLPLLVDALEKAAEGLPVCLYVLFTLILLFSPLIYLCEPRENVESMPKAMWLCVVTMTTVGYGDITPETTLGSVIVSALVVLSVLYMAVPLGIVGNAFTEVWHERDFILLRYRTKAKFAHWGFTPDDVPALFRMFTAGDDGELEIHEFREMMAEMKLGLSGKRVKQLFEALDEDGGGSIDDREFVKRVFPEAYSAIYRMDMSRDTSKSSGDY